MSGIVLHDLTKVGPYMWGKYCGDSGKGFYR